MACNRFSTAVKRSSNGATSLSIGMSRAVAIVSTYKLGL